MEQIIMKIYSLYLIISICLLSSCGEESTKPKTDNYSDYIQTGWTYFSNENYPNAISEFRKALELKENLVDSYTGLGWSYLRLDSISVSDSIFSQGATKEGDNTNLIAGWAFSLNALKNYSASNIKIQSIISTNNDWVFGYGLNLNISHLYLLAAMNSFALGDLAESLIYVTYIDEEFQADISTYDGQTKLADKIETLRAELQLP